MQNGLSNLARSIEKIFIVLVIDKTTLARKLWFWSALLTKKKHLNYQNFKTSLILNNNVELLFKISKFLSNYEALSVHSSLLL